MNLEQVCQDMKEYLSKFAWARILMPLSPIILYVLCALLVLDDFVSIGSVAYQLAYLGSFVMLVLVLAQCRFLDVAIGFAAHALECLIVVIQAMIPPYSYLSWSNLIQAAFYGVLAFLAYKKSVSFR